MVDLADELKNLQRHVPIVVDCLHFGNERCIVLVNGMYTFYSSVCFK